MPRSIAPEAKALARLLHQDRRYKQEAYHFVRAGLGYAQEVLTLGRESEIHEQADDRTPLRHVTGQDLCWALRQFAHEQYGLMARLVLADWGVRSTSDFGEIVYNLIRVGVMSKSPTDRRADFNDVFEFDQSLVRDFQITLETQEA